MITLTKKSLIIGALGIAGVAGASTYFITSNITNNTTSISIEAPEEPQAEKGTVYTVDWYLKHDEVRKSTVRECSNNPGELMETPNCINASKAAAKASIGNPADYGW